MIARCPLLFSLAKTARSVRPSRLAPQLCGVRAFSSGTRQSSVLDDETMQNFSAQMHKDKSRFTMDAAAKHQLHSPEQDKSSRVKNVSLSLLDIKHPAKVLDFFQSNYLDRPLKDVYVEELLMVLHNLKLLLREIDDQSAKDLMVKDTRANALVAMVMEGYVPETDIDH